MNHWKKRNAKTYAMLTCAVLACLYRPVYAAEGHSSAVTTRDVIVEADTAKEEAKQESQQVTIITKEEIAKKQAKSVEDIIFNETGVTRTIDAMGRVGVSIRGAEPRHTLILIDGQPVMGDLAKYSGAGDELQRMGTENVERIEIIKGAASAKYGADAIGGVINVITRKAAKTAGLQVNAEGRRIKGDNDAFPYSNFFLRADSGQMDKLRFSVYGSKRDIMPIYSEETFRGINNADTVRNSLRYYGDIKSVGFIGAYDIDEHNKIDFNIDHTDEDMERYVKHSNSVIEPQQHFKRNVERNTEQLNYTGNNGGNTDWKVSYDYTKTNEDDITLSSYYANSQYEGKNTLSNIDDVKHKQWNLKASANTQINDKHLLSYGFGYSRETGEGSRLKNAPDTYTRYIDPWDYDKNLFSSGGTGAPASNVHDYAMAVNSNGVPYYDQEYEWYGSKDANGNTILPIYTYQDFIKYGYRATGAPADVVARWEQFDAELRAENPNLAILPKGYLINYYYADGVSDEWKANFKGKKFKQEYNERQNRQIVGSAEIKKQNFFVQDTWQINKDTILAPILRVDHSDLFGTNATFNMGLTHNINGNANRRFKANIGTGYTEPGMGELYYNWEMYGGMPSGFYEGKLGYYWVGNPDLKPEKSVNFDIGIEGENGNTSSRLNIFHNRIDDYMTTYFTGYLMDFYPSEDQGFKWMMPPDMIYSFKNIGRAEITGLEAELQHKFNDNWSGKLGYTYLYALNKSDPNMPDRLLDKPQHKVDIGLNYENKKSNLRASLWGNYYINMLDSNSVANNGNYLTYDGEGNVKYNFAEGGKQTYEKKTFGLWNLLVQKDLSKDSSVYFGIDNLFDHRDDDRAFQERVYKVGLNMKFGAPRKTAAENLKKDKPDAAEIDTISKNNEENHIDGFIEKPFDESKKNGVEIIGDYRLRMDSHTGENKIESRVTASSSVGDAAKNISDKADHGFNQRLRVGVDARIGDSTNVTVLGSAAGASGVDTAKDIVDSSGLNHQRLDKADLTHHSKKWDFSGGRLTESMGVTGYWFGKEYDGARAVWTDKGTQLRFGYGDFSQSTGITDSAYTHATRQVFFRAPTKFEWLGYDDRTTPWDGVYSDFVVNVDGYQGLYQKLAQTSDLAEQQAIVNQYLAVIKQNDTAAYDEITNAKTSASINTFAWKSITVTNEKTGEKVGDFIAMVNPADNKTGTISYADFFNQTKLDETAEAVWNNIEDTLETNGEKGEWLNKSSSFLLNAGDYVFTSTFLGYAEYKGDQVLQSMGSEKYVLATGEFNDTNFTMLTKDEAKAKAITSLWNGDNALKSLKSVKRTSPTSGAVKIGYKAADMAVTVKALIDAISDDDNWNPEDGSSMPLQLLEKLGETLSVEGTVLVKDVIPAIDRAFFVQAKHELTPNFGVAAWYLRSTGDKQHSFAAANGDSNDIATFDKLANVIGLGAKWKLGEKASVSFDWGQNRTDFGRYMNGHTVYQHETGTSDFKLQGRAEGGTPHFWSMRFDLGKADMAEKGSWNAFADYKYFEHGAFFGGNGTESLPDRYLDGIKSFTVGAGYVPHKDLLVETFYTFGAKGIGKRDTLYGAENFKLGDYAGVQLTYSF